MMDDGFLQLRTMSNDTQIVLLAEQSLVRIILSTVASHICILLSLILDKCIVLCH